MSILTDIVYNDEASVARINYFSNNVGLSIKCMAGQSGLIQLLKLSNHQPI